VTPWRGKKEKSKDEAAPLGHIEKKWQPFSRGQGKRRDDHGFCREPAWKNGWVKKEKSRGKKRGYASLNREGPERAKKS